MTGTLSRMVAGVAFTVAVAASPAVAQQATGTLFPEPFLIEHAVVQTDADGTVFATEPVTDYYGGSWIVSQRADGSRVVIDFARREITEIRTATASYTVIGFDRMARLVRELQILEGPAPSESDDAAGKEKAEGPRLRVVEARGGEAPSLKRASVTNPLLERPGVRHLQILADDPVSGATTAVLEAWLDPEIHFSAPALEALDGFESEVLNAATGGGKALSVAALALARSEADGAVPVMTLRPITADRPGTGSVEDTARRIEALEIFPIELVGVPEAFRRDPHPLELMVAHASREAELRRQMAGGHDQ
jgi:hypothetical protein